MGPSDVDRARPEGISGRVARLAFAVLMVGMTALTVWVVVSAFSSSEAADSTRAEPAASGAGADEQGSAQAASADPVPDACPPTADACVDTRLRISWLQEDGHITYGPVPIMPGMAGQWATPQGTFHVEWKSVDWVSTEFDQPMPNAVFFAPGGIAFHQGPLADLSHGCVHLSKEASQYYFDNLPVGAEVAVFGGYPPPDG